MNRTEGAGTEAPADHRNEQWWRDHGGAEWLEEYRRRRPNQAHYGQQEAFLRGFFLGLPPVRVLDFGCGFGRHLQNLRAYPWLDLHGCDLSAKMVEVARRDSGFSDADRRIQQIEARGILPYDD